MCRLSRWAYCVGAVLWGLMMLPTSPVSAQARDPHLKWRTIRSEHFALHYHEPLGLVARRALAIAERAHATLVPVMGHRPHEITHIVLSDNTDSANGSANAIPYNHINLFATAPDALSPLADHDDWLNELIIHEYVHVLHLDTIHGVPALVNKVLGKVWPPNSIQPRWFVEGLAVVQESDHTAGGRLRSTTFDMYLRMDALEGQFLRLDQISNGVNRWPYGNVWYLYGSNFLEFVADRHGRHVLKDMSHDYGGNIVPYSLNRTAKRATGETFDEMYEAFEKQKRDEALALKKKVMAEGWVVGQPLTSGGHGSGSAEFVDDGSLLFYESDGEEVSQVRRMWFEPAPDVMRARGEWLKLTKREKVVRTSGNASLAAAGSTWLLSDNDQHRDMYFFRDLFALSEEGERTRLTYGMRADHPTLSRDGRRVAFTINGASTSHLAIADVDDIEDTHRILVRSGRFEQIYSPRFSPDDRTIAFSRWQHGGYRDIWLVDVETGALTRITHDRALDTAPCFSPDGETLYFSSDRSGVANIYAHELASGRTRKLTNVLGGAYEPTVSPDGKILVYSGYRSRGFDLYALDLTRPPRFESTDGIPAYEDTRPEPAEAITLDVSSEAYSPWETTLPRAYELELTEDGFGPQLGVLFNGGDIAGHHTYSGRIGVGLVRGNPQANLGFSQNRSLIPFSLSGFYAEGPRGGLEVAGELREWVQRAMGGTFALGYSLPAALEGQSVSASYSLTYVDKAEPFGGELDPNDRPPVLPRLGLFGIAGAGWSFSNVTRTPRDISASGGFSLSFNVRLASEWLGSDFNGSSLSWTATRYLENPAIERHVLALRYAGGMSRGLNGFSVGGFPQAAALEQLLDQTQMGGVAMRGYDPGVDTGSQYHLLQAEYRFPLLDLERGLSTLPFYLRKTWGAIFHDLGEAYGAEGFTLDDLRGSVGAEVYTQFAMGYIINLNLRIGIAHGWGKDGKTEGYFHLGVPF